MRRWTALLAVVFLLVDALASAFVGLVLGTAVHRQHMSFGGADPNLMSLGAYVGLGLQGGFLLLVAAVLVAVAVRNRAPGRFGRIVLLAGAILVGVLAAVSLALSGPLSFAVLTVTLTLLVLQLLGTGMEPRTAVPAPAEAEQAAPPQAPPAPAQ
jgi:hypothetical protein